MALSDERLAELGHERDELVARRTKIQRKIDKIDAKIIKELERRSTKLITNDDGYRVRLVRNSNTFIKEDVLRTRLKKSVLKRCLKEVIDKGAFSREIQAGNVDPKIVAAATGVRYSAPYVKTGQE